MSERLSDAELNEIESWIDDYEPRGVPKLIDRALTELRKLRRIRDAAADGMKRIGPDGYVPSFGKPISDRLRAALAAHDSGPEGEERT